MRPNSWSAAIGSQWGRALRGTRFSRNKPAPQWAGYRQARRAARISVATQPYSRRLRRSIQVHTLRWVLLGARASRPLLRGLLKELALTAGRDARARQSRLHMEHTSRHNIPLDKYLNAVIDCCVRRIGESWFYAAFGWTGINPPNWLVTCAHGSKRDSRRFRVYRRGPSYEVPWTVKSLPVVLADFKKRNPFFIAYPGMLLILKDRK